MTRNRPLAWTLWNNFLRTSAMPVEGAPLIALAAAIVLGHPQHRSQPVSSLASIPAQSWGSSAKRPGDGEARVLDFNAFRRGHLITIAAMARSRRRRGE